MAQVTEVRLVDDLDGGAAAESVAFGIDGRFYEIDLNEAHAARLREVFAPFVSSARRASGGSPASPRVKTATRAGRSRGETAAIREWAIAHGHEVANRGRIPAQVVEAYESRDSAPSAAPAPAAAPAVVEAQESEAVAANKPKRRARKKAAAAS
jgi:Lsr2